MSIVAQVTDIMQNVLQESADEAAIICGAIQRQRKFTGSTLVQTLTFAFLQKPDASYADIAQTARALGVDVTREAIANRMTHETAETLKMTLETAASQCVEPPPQELPLLSQFNGVYVQDSSWVSLPDELSSVWKGTGCRTTDNKAAIKLQVRFDVLTGAFDHFQLTDGITSDRKADRILNHSPLGVYA